MNKIKLINPKYKVELFRDSETGTFYYNNGHNDFIKQNAVSGINLFDLLNDVDYNTFYIVEVANHKEIPKDLFVYYYDLITLMKSYYEGNKSGLGSDTQITFNKFLESI